MTAAYADDVMGNGVPLPPDVVRRLVPGLRAHPTSLVFLAWVDDTAVGIATCFLEFSTFAARTLINVHDLAVIPTMRGQGVARALLAAVEVKARSLGCAKLTLEVQEHNRRARGLYERFGFSHVVHVTGTGGSLCYMKPL